MRLSGLVTLLAMAAPAAAQQGNLVSAEPVAQTLAGMQAWKIRYLSRDDRGVQQTLTGVVIAPREAVQRTARKVIAWTHGTWGTADQCTPSRSPRFFAATPALDAVRQGYVVVAPDYPGLGVPGPHPYLIGAVTGRSVIDAVRAARAIPVASAGGDYAVWGESQGGHAALIQRIARNCITVDKGPKLGTMLGILALRQDLARVDLGSTPPWPSYAAANSTSPVSRVPVLFAQTQGDPLVAPAVTRAFARRMCSNRVRVKWIDLPGKDHATTAKQNAAATLQWINGRFAGVQAPNDCGRF